jgi:hypothetical protein
VSARSSAPSRVVTVWSRRRRISAENGEQRRTANNAKTPSEQAVCLLLTASPRAIVSPHNPSVAGSIPAGPTRVTWGNVIVAARVGVETLRWSPFDHGCAPRSLEGGDRCAHSGASGRQLSCDAAELGSRGPPANAKPPSSEVSHIRDSARNLCTPTKFSHARVPRLDIRAGVMTHATRSSCGAVCGDEPQSRSAFS